MCVHVRRLMTMMMMMAVTEVLVLLTMCVLLADAVQAQVHALSAWIAHSFLRRLVDRSNHFHLSLSLSLHERVCLLACLHAHTHASLIYSQLLSLLRRSSCALIPRLCSLVFIVSLSLSR